MAHSINLVPQDEVFEQAKSRIVRFSTILSVLLLIIVGGISFYLVTQKTKLDSEINSLDTRISKLRSDIESLSAIEITARNLDKRYNVVSGLYKSQELYSVLLKEVSVRTPGKIIITNFNIREGKVEISGEGEDYLSISDFTNNLLDENFEGADPNYKNLFTSVSLNSVNLRGKEGKVDYALVISYEPSLLLRK